MLERLTVSEVLDRLDKIEAEKNALRTLLRTLRVHQSSPRRKLEGASA